MPMDIDFSNAVRVLATADQQSIIQFCEDSGAIDSVLGFKDSYDVGDSILFIQFKRLSSVLDLKRRSKLVKLGGRSILVEALADSSILQEQCRMICKPTLQASGRTPYSARFSRTLSDKENYPQSSYNRPSSAPAGKLMSSDARGILNGDLRMKALQPTPVTRLDLRQSARPRSHSYRTTSDDSTVTTFAGLLSPLSKSPTLLRRSTRSNVVQDSRASMLGSPVLRPGIPTTRRTQSFLLRHSRSSFQSGETITLRNTAEESQRKYMKSSIATIRKELDEAKEKYARSLEIVKGHLAMMERRCDI